MLDWIAWLDSEHLADVLQGGATSATVIQYDGASRCDVRYIFPNRESFDRYEDEIAPALRADGLKRFPLTLGLEYSRSTATVVAEAEAGWG